MRDEGGPFAALVRGRLDDDLGAVVETIIGKFLEDKPRQKILGTCAGL
jgi:hypothetical protein